MENLIAILAIAFIIGYFVWVYKMTHKNTKFGRFVRWHWNTSMKFCSKLPLSGWLANFIVAETEEEIAIKEEYIASGEASDAKWDKMVIDYLDEKARRERRAEQVRQEILKRNGTDFNIADDGSSATYTDRDGVKVNLKVDWK